MNRKALLVSMLLAATTLTACASNAPDTVASGDQSSSSEEAPTTEVETPEVQAQVDPFAGLQEVATWMAEADSGDKADVTVKMGAPTVLTDVTDPSAVELIKTCPNLGQYNRVVVVPVEVDASSMTGGVPPVQIGLGRPVDFGYALSGGWTVGPDLPCDGELADWGNLGSQPKALQAWIVQPDAITPKAPTLDSPDSILRTLALPLPALMLNNNLAGKATNLSGPNACESGINSAVLVDPKACG